MKSWTFARLNWAKGAATRALSARNLFEAYFHADQLADAKRAGGEALRLVKKVFGENHPRYAEVVYDLGVTYESLGQWSKAADMIQESIPLIKTEFGDRSEHYMRALDQACAYILFFRRLR